VKFTKNVEKQMGSWIRNIAKKRFFPRQRVGNTLQENPEQQSLALLLLCIVYRRRGKRAAFADCLGRLLRRQRCQPEAITVQACCRLRHSNRILVFVENVENFVLVWRARKINLTLCSFFS
jgi:hypothetical protein